MGGPEGKEELIERIAKRIVSMRLEVPAIIFLEMNKPLGFIAGQSMLLASGILGPILGFSRVEEFAEFLGDREKVEALIERIEELSRERRG
jgi:hypothetical protein